MNPNPIWPIPGTRWFDNRPLKEKAPLLFWLTFAAVAFFACLRSGRYLIWTAWIGWFLLPFVAMRFEYWWWSRAPRIARRKRSRELRREEQERFGLAKS